MSRQDTKHAVNRKRVSSQLKLSQLVLPVAKAQANCLGDDLAAEVRTELYLLALDCKEKYAMRALGGFREHDPFRGCLGSISNAALPWTPISYRLKLTDLLYCNCV